MLTDVLLLFWFAGWLVYEFMRGSLTEKQVLSGQKNKLQVYVSTIAILWLPTILLLIHFSLGGISAMQLGLSHTWHIYTYGAWLLCFVVLAYFIYSIRAFETNSCIDEGVNEQFQTLAWLLPSTKKERNWFILGVSASAGFCEELLFRGYLLHVIEQSFGTIVAVIGSSLLFGLFHIYQGWQAVLRTSVVGLILALIYLVSGSLWVVIVIHFAVDAYSGQLFYTINKKANTAATSSLPS